MTPIRLPLTEPDGPLDLQVRTSEEGLGHLLEDWSMQGRIRRRHSGRCVHARRTDAAWGDGRGDARSPGVIARLPYVRGAAKRWSRDGLVVVAIDAPYHGDRALDQVPDLARNEPFLIQTVGDLRRLCSAIESDSRLVAAPLGYLGFSMGALVGVPLHGVGARIRAGVFAVGGATGTGTTDPATYAPLIRDRPVLLVSADRDEFFSRASVTALYEAFGGSQELLMFPGYPRQLAASGSSLSGDVRFLLGVHLPTRVGTEARSCS